MNSDDAIPRLPSPPPAGRARRAPRAQAIPNIMDAPIPHIGVAALVPEPSPFMLFQAGSDRPYQVMFGRGPAFSHEIRPSLARIQADLTSADTQYGGLHALGELSRRNLTAAHALVPDQTEDEQAFVRHWTGMNFTATHFTTTDVRERVDVADRLTMQSRGRLEDEGVVPNAHHSPELVRQRFRNENFAFFSLEPGQDSDLKATSRFGSNKFTVPMMTDEGRVHPVFSNSMVTLVDQHVSSQRALPTSRATQAFMGQAATYDPDQSWTRVHHESMVFQAQDMGQAIGLNLIHRLRSMNSRYADTQAAPWTQQFTQQALASRDSEQLNSLLNGFLDPQVMVPRILSTTHYRQIVKGDHPGSSAGVGGAAGEAEPNTPNLPATPPPSPRMGPRSRAKRDAAFREIGER